MPRLRGIALLAAACVCLSACGGLQSGKPIEAPDEGRVLVFGIPSITWEDIDRAEPPTILALAGRGAKGNVSVRVSNFLGEGYATIGMVQRVQVDLSAGWVFNAGERVENGSAAELFQRRNGNTPDGEVAAVQFEQIRRRNADRAFNASPGLLAETLSKKGMDAAVVGNADLSLGPLPARLPPGHRAASPSFPDPGIHREAALLAMRSNGTVARGDVSRGLLRADPEAPYGISTSPDALAAAFDRVWKDSHLVVVENGDTGRADSYSAGFGVDQREAWRDKGLAMADIQLKLLLRRVDLKRTMVVVVAPTTPGGVEERGQLRPVILAGAGVPMGTLRSLSTQRDGLLWMPDLGATIANYVGAAGDRLGGGRVATVAADRKIDELVRANARAVSHDRMRAPVSITIMALSILLYVFSLNRLKRGPLSDTVHILLLAAMAFPAASYVSTAGFWRLGDVAAALLVLLLAIAIGWGVWSVAPRQPSSLLIVTALSTAFFLIDLALGAPAQIDSIFGYTSVAGGRFYGLGNLGFALMAAGAILLAGVIADPPRVWARWLALGLLALTTLWIGHPRLGGDFGGTITMVPAFAAFAMRSFGKGKLQRKWLPALVLAGFGLVILFGLIDLARPPSARTHIGDFFANSLDDPASIWLIVKRKVSSGLSLAVANYWGFALPGAVGVFILLHRRSPNLRQLLHGHPGFSAALDGVVIAAIIGSLLNDSGIAIAGMMLALTAPWLLAVASHVQERELAGG